MSAELVGIISLGVGFSVLVVGLFAWLRADIATLRNEMRDEFAVFRAEMSGTRNEIRGEFASTREELRGEIGGVRGEVAELRVEVSQLRERMAHLEGLLEGLREAITGRVAS